MNAHAVIYVEFSFNFYTSFQNINNSTASDADYQVVIANLDLRNVPDFTKEQYEFILIDLQCDGAVNILIENEAKLTNYHWILLDMQSTEVL